MLPEPFYIICFLIFICTSVVSLFFGLTLIIVVIVHRPCRTVNNMMMCNTAAATVCFSTLQIISSGFALQNNWLTYQPACILRAYCYTAVCTAVGCSYGAQSISRLFFAVLYKQRCLLTWRVHWYLIVGNHLLTVLGPLPQLFFGHGYRFEVEDRLCLASTKVLSTSLLAVVIAYVIPLTIIIVVYSIIVYKARQSTRRVAALREPKSLETITNTPLAPNFKREMTLMKNIFILVGLLTCAGLPYLSLVFWHAVQREPAPEPCYLLSMLAVTVFISIKMVALFLMSTDVKNVAVEYLQKLRRR